MKRGSYLLLIAILGTLPAGAAEDGKTVTGGFEVGYRSVTVDGNEDKYREDVNLSDNALRLFGLDLAWRPERSGALDDLTLEAQGLGGEPYESARLRARKSGLWDLKADFRSSSNFYRDAGYFFRDGGDLHSWDTKRAFYDLDFRVRATGWLTLRAGADRMNRDGSSTTSRDVQRDVFELQRPVDQTATNYWLGADFRLGWSDLTVEQRLASYENNWVMTSGGNDGLEPGGATLIAYRQQQIQNGDAPVTRISLSGKPVEMLRFGIGYVRVGAKVDYSTNGAWDGLDYDAAPTGNAPEPYQTALNNAGSIERTVDVFSADMSVRPVRQLELTLEGSRRSYDQDGTINSLETQTGGKDQGTYTVVGSVHNELQLDGSTLTARWQVVRALALSAGFGWQKRTASFQIAGPDVVTTRTLYRVGLRCRPKDVVDFGVDLERGNDEDPYTPVSPTDTQRVKADVNVRPGAGVRLGFRYKDESRKNDLTYPLGRPTDDTPPATETGNASFDVTSWGATVGWSRGDRVDLTVAYDRTEIRSDAAIVYVTGYTFVPLLDVFTTLDRTGYVSDQDAVFGQLRVSAGRGFSVGVSTSLVRNEGTFPVDWSRYGAEGRYQLASGVFARLAFDHYSLDETNPYAGDPATPTPDVNDFDADLWTVSVGYRF